MHVRLVVGTRGRHATAPQACGDVHHLQQVFMTLRSAGDVAWALKAFLPCGMSHVQHAAMAMARHYAALRLPITVLMWELDMSSPWVSAPVKFTGVNRTG